MMKLSTSKRLGATHVTATALQAGLVLACANAQADDVAFGDGLELALTRAAEGQAETAPEWVQLFPKGPEIKARDGRNWTLPDHNALALAFQGNGADLPFDVNHATEIKGPKGEEAEAFGWIKEIQARDDGTTWARVDWTEEGAAAVASKKYRYVSPAFLFDKNNQIRAVTSAALVTHPALNMPALARRGGGNPEDHNQMKTLAERLREALGLSADVSDDAIVTAATTQVALARDARDPEKFVPAADLQAAQARAQTAETKLADREKADKEAKATALIEAAVAEGKIPPASKEHWLGLARDSFETTEKALGAMPKLVGPSELKKDPEGDPADANGLTADQKALCRDLGIDEKAYAANLKKEQA